MASTLVAPEAWVRIPLPNLVDTAECDVLTTIKSNIKPAWIGANKTIPKYGHYSTMGENEISSVTALVYGFGNYPPKNKLHILPWSSGLPHLPVTQGTAGSNPVGSV